MSQNMNQMLQQMVLIVPLIIVFVWMFFSQKKKTKQVQEMIDSIKPGANIKTIGGFYGKVTNVKEDVITFECGPDKTKLVISKAAVSTVENAETVNEGIGEK